MASISNDKNGTKRILFIDGKGIRKAIRIGKVSKRDAQTVKLKVEALLSAKLTGASGVDKETAEWIARIDKKLLAKLKKADLLPEEVKDSVKDEKQDVMTIQRLADRFINEMGKGKKPGTISQWNQVRTLLLEILDGDLPLEAVTRGHATQYLEAIKEGRASATVFKHLATVKQWFSWAVDWEIISHSPFDRVRVSKGNAKNNVEVPRETVAEVMKACDDPWKAIIALARYGGLRTPSETLSIRWEDIDFAKRIMRVPEPKVEHHQGRGVRECPLFPEVREVLEPMKKSEGYVVDKPAYRAAANTGEGWKNANLRTQLLKKLKKAEIEPWPRLFHSLRASRQTELLSQGFSLHVVCAWLGNSPVIAQKSYLLVTGDDWAKAVNGAQKAAQ